MPTLSLDDAWFLANRRDLLRPSTHGEASRFASIARSIFGNADKRGKDARLAGQVQVDTERAFRHLAPRHATAARAHMQLYRACLETIGLVPSDAIVNAAVQIEWFWYTTPFKRFYRDHLAHVMKVALTGLRLLDDPEGPLAHDGIALLDRVADGLARRAAGEAHGEEFGSDAIHAAARWCGNTPEALRNPAFWKAAVRETVRIAGLLHDMAYPDVMSLKVDHAARAVRPRSPFDLTEEDVSRRAISFMTHHLVTAPFNGGALPGPLPLGDKGCEVAEIVFGLSHSLRGAHTLLGFLATTHRAMPLRPFDAFVLEWAALAIAMHDYDKLFELTRKEERSLGPEEQTLRAWFLDGVNRNAIRPCFRDDPVSYVVALADQLQDFGRMHYEPPTRSPDKETSLDEAVHVLRYPCEAVLLEADGALGELEASISFRFGDEAASPFGATRAGAEESAKTKAPQGAPEPVFGDHGWLRHDGLFRQVRVRVHHGNRDLTNEGAAAGMG